jgi:hypothetical protein
MCIRGFLCEADEMAEIDRKQGLRWLTGILVLVGALAVVYGLAEVTTRGGMAPVATALTGSGFLFAAVLIQVSNARS